MCTKSGSAKNGLTDFCNKTMGTKKSRGQTHRFFEQEKCFFEFLLFSIYIEKLYFFNLFNTIDSLFLMPILHSSHILRNYLPSWISNLTSNLRSQITLNTTLESKQKKTQNSPQIAFHFTSLL